LAETLRETIRQLVDNTSRQFWLYHFSGLGFLYVLLCTIFYFSGPRAVLGFNLIATSIWCVNLTIAVLFLRRNFHRKNWVELPFTTLAIKVTIPVFVLGFLVAVIMWGVVLPFYLYDVLAYISYRYPEMKGGVYLLNNFLRSWFQSMFHIAAWFGAYLAITTSRRINETQIANLKLQAVLKETQLSHLSNQLNPHFLFNALNNIRFMVNEDAAQAQSMLVSLSDVLRYSLQSGSEEKVALAEEVELIDKYSELMKAQFEDRMQFDMAIPQEFLNQSVPPMVLQIMLENALKHGLERLPEGGNISLSAHEENKSLVIRMCNDIPTSAQASPSNMGIGLKNIRQRLSLIYGSLSTIETNIVDKQFRVEMRLPIDNLVD